MPRKKYNWIVYKPKSYSIGAYKGLSFSQYRDLWRNKHKIYSSPKKHYGYSDIGTFVGGKIYTATPSINRVQKWKLAFKHKKGTARSKFWEWWNSSDD